MSNAEGRVAAHPYDFPHEGRIEPSRCALLVIDLQEDFLGKAGYFALMGEDPGPLRRILPNVAALVLAARSVGMRVVFTRQGYRADRSDMSAYDRWRRDRADLPDHVLVRDTPGFEVVSELAPVDGDVIIDKTANSAFVDTELGRTLLAGGIKHLVLTGCTTEVCVHSTLRSAIDLGYECLLVEDACASGNPEIHDAAVRMVTVENGVFGVVASTESVVAALRSLDPAGPR